MSSTTWDQEVAKLTELANRLGVPDQRLATTIEGREGDLEGLRKLRRRWAAQDRANHTRLSRATDAKALDTFTQESRLIHGQRLEVEARQRRLDRGRLTPGARLDRVLAAVRAMSTQPAAGLSASSRSCDEPIGPPGLRIVDGEPMAYLPTVETGPHTTVILAHIEELEFKLDAERGLVPPHDYAKMNEEAKDRMIIRLEGVHARDVARDFPWLGSQRTVENKRKALGRRPSTGERLERVA